MGTRGYWAIVYKGKMYVMYNHWDSYPQRPGLGWNLVQDITWGNIETWKKALESIHVVDANPTTEDVLNLHQYTDLNVGSGSSDDWYCLTRKCQGSVERTLRSGYLLDASSPFTEDNLANRLGAQEWGYAIDLDKNEFRTFQGAEIHFWRFPLDAIPEGIFLEPSIRAFNRISDGDEFPSYYEASDAIVRAYARYYEEEKGKVTKEKEEKKRKHDKESKDSSEEGKFKASIEEIRKNVGEQETCKLEKERKLAKLLEEGNQLAEERIQLVETINHNMRHMNKLLEEKNAVTAQGVQKAKLGD